MNDRARISANRQWLTALLLLHLATLVLSWIGYLPIPTGWISWVQKAISVGIILCLFLLTPANPRYRKAAFFRTGIFLCTMVSLILTHLIAKLLFYPGQTIQVILGLLSALFSLFACWFEYRSHGEMAPSLSKGWLGLFVATLAVFILSCAITAVYALLPTGVPVAAATVTSTLTLILADLLELAYVILLFFTLQKVK